MRLIESNPIGMNPRAFSETISVRSYAVLGLSLFFSPFSILLFLITNSINSRVVGSWVLGFLGSWALGCSDSCSSLPRAALQGFLILRQVKQAALLSFAINHPNRLRFLHAPPPLTRMKTPTRSSYYLKTPLLEISSLHSSKS